MLGTKQQTVGRPIDPCVCANSMALSLPVNHNHTEDPFEPTVIMDDVARHFELLERNFAITREQ